MSYSLVNTTSFGSDNWCLNLAPVYQHSLLTGLSNGQVHQLDWQTGKSISNIKTGEVAVNRLKIINNDYESGSTYATATMGAVKIWDVRSNSCLATISNDKNAPFLSLDSGHNMLACGTELSGSDAELHIYDIRKWDSPLKSLIDSHHDDITDISFHPSDPNVLMSGSTDGYANIYDLRQVEEEDALHQVINFASIHSCGWLAPRRIFTLSHMETFAIHELNDKSDEAKEPRPVEFNDIRGSWGCDYVVDIRPGYVACGNSQEGTGKLRILPLQGEQVDTNNVTDINAAHEDEVVRDVLVPAHNSKILYSCGEDGNVKTWENITGPLNVPKGFWDYSQLLNVLDEQPVVETKSTETKHSKKKHNKSKKSNKQRFKPY